jgi:23S rRNA pseudouridine2605 synthase
MKTRLQRFLADCGIASRRQCEEMILAGRVRVNGDVRTTMPVMVEPETDIITVDDERVGQAARQPAVPEVLKEQERVYFLLNKPKGILVTNLDPSHRKTVSELMEGVKERVFPVGRLDMDSRGALIMTNDGELANRLTHPRYGIEKTYMIEVDGRLGHADIEKLKRGMWLGPERPGGGAPASPSAPSGHGPRGIKTDRFHIKLIGRERGRTLMEVRLSEAKNREIRRVMARIGHNVRDLNRVAIAGKITIKGLDVGAYRRLTEAEVKWLYRASSPEFHASQKSSTQAWYEAKEMEKERKRLVREARETAAAPRKLPTPVSQDAAPAERREQFRRPERKGRKPFIPPSGRNAGMPLGGNLAGRRRLAREGRGVRGDSAMAPGPSGDMPPHPLGRDAKSED